MYHRLIKPRRQQPFWHRALLRTVLLFLFLTGYLWMAEYLGGFVANYTQQLWIEGLLALYMYGLGYIVLRPSRWRSYLAAVPLLLFYLTSRHR